MSWLISNVDHIVRSHSNFGLSFFSVTSQPQGVSVSTFMSGTLASAKRAFGTVSDTVSTLMNGGDGHPVVVTQEIVSIVVNMRLSRCCARHLSKEG